MNIIIGSLRRRGLLFIGLFVTVALVAGMVALSGIAAVQPAFADRSGTSLNREGCQPEAKTRPSPAIYNGLEGVALLISAPFIEDDAPYAALLSKENLSDIFRESIEKNVLKFVKPSGSDCSIPPEFYEFYRADFKYPEKWAEIDRITDNPKVVTIHIQVTRLRIDEQKDRQAAAVIFNAHRAGFKSGLSGLGISVLDLTKSPAEISESLNKFRDSKYFLTNY